MDFIKKWGLFSAHTGQVVVTDPAAITANWNQTSVSSGVALWGSGADELIAALAEETAFQIDKINNWYRIVGEITSEQLYDIARSAQLDVYAEPLRGDAIFEQLRALNESPIAGGVHGNFAATAFMGMGMYPVSSNDKHLVIGNADVSSLFKADLGTIQTSGILLICDPANIRLYDYEVEGEDNILPHIHDLASSNGGGQLTFTGHKTQEFFIVAKMVPGTYQINGYYHLDADGLRTYSSLILSPSI